MSSPKHRAEVYLKAAAAAELEPGDEWRVSVEEAGDLHGDFLVVQDCDGEESEVLRQGADGTGADCEFAAMASTTGVLLALDMLAVLRRAALWKQAARSWRREAIKQRGEVQKLSDLRERDAYIAHLKRAIASAVDNAKHDEEEIRRLRALSTGRILLPEKGTLIGWVGVQEPGAEDEACPTSEQIHRHAAQHPPGLWMCQLPRYTYMDVCKQIATKPPEFLVGPVVFDDCGVPWLSAARTQIPLRDTTGRAGAKGYRIWPLNASGDKVPRSNHSDIPNHSLQPSINELAVRHFCDRCNGFVQHCPTLSVETRLKVAERIVELRREDLAEAQRRTSLYDHEEEMLENAEQVLQEVKDEAAAEAGGTDAARPA